MFEDIVRKLIKEMNDEELKNLNSIVQKEMHLRGMGDLTDGEIKMCKSNKRINAIKSIRNRTGFSLKATVKLVDKWMSDNGL